MVANDVEGIPRQECTPPGALRITPAAMRLLEKFQAAVPSGWIAAFSWYDGGRIRKDKDSPWVETGPGIDLGAYRAVQIPGDVIWRTGSLRFAVLIREAVLSTHAKRTITLNDEGKPFLE